MLTFHIVCNLHVLLVLEHVDLLVDLCTVNAWLPEHEHCDIHLMTGKLSPTTQRHGALHVFPHQDHHTGALVGVLWAQSEEK